MRVHLIAIGGSAMHNMALALHEKGYFVTGSDDEINEPSKTRLFNKGLLPEKLGWFPEKITRDIDAIILGMHARIDNPELEEAKKLGIKIFSYPEYIYEATKDKIRVVVGGSHGKTSITSMILHVLKQNKIDADFMVGAQLEGFDTMVKLTKEAKVVVIEGDEYLASPLDRRPKFHLYKPNIALLSGIAWDHINVFPTFENYVDQFKTFINLIENYGSLIYCEQDLVLKRIATESGITNSIKKIPYGIPRNEIEKGITYLLVEDQKIPLKIFGDHNLMNVNGARLVCEQLGISDTNFYDAIKTFKGAAKRLELVFSNSDFDFYKDFAHSPSKLKATTAAVKQQFPSRRIVACMELHTFSSLTEAFLKEYNGAMKMADEAIVYYNPHTIEHKKLTPISEEQVNEAFGQNNLLIFTESKVLMNYLKLKNWNNTVLLMMSSGNFDGINFDVLAKELDTSKP